MRYCCEIVAAPAPQRLPWAVLRAQREEWSYAREDTGEWAGQVRFVLTMSWREKRVGNCVEEDGMCVALYFVFALFDIQARIFEGRLLQARLIA